MFSALDYSVSSASRTLADHSGGVANDAIFATEQIKSNWFCESCPLACRATLGKWPSLKTRSTQAQIVVLYDDRTSAIHLIKSHFSLNAQICPSTSRNVWEISVNERLRAASWCCGWRAGSRSHLSDSRFVCIAKFLKKRICVLVGRAIGMDYFCFCSECLFDCLCIDWSIQFENLFPVSFWSRVHTAETTKKKKIEGESDKCRNSQTSNAVTLKLLIQRE